MPRVRKGAARTQARKRILRLARGYYGVKHKHKYQAENALMRAGVYQFRDRRRLKRDMRRLWITRITAACRMRKTRYSLFINGLKLAGILLNRKMLSNLAIEDPKTFDRIVELAGAALKAKTPAPKTNPHWGGEARSNGAMAGTTKRGLVSAGGGRSGSATNIEDIEGIGPKFASQLAKANVKTISELLAAGRTAKGREDLATKSGIKVESIHAWTKQADLLRVTGMSPDWAELMIASGVDSVKELSHRVPGHLRSSMDATNKAGAKQISPNLPSEAELTAFVNAAKGMPGAIES